MCLSEALVNLTSPHWPVLFGKSRRGRPVCNISRILDETVRLLGAA